MRSKYNDNKVPGPGSY